MRHRFTNQCSGTEACFRDEHELNNYTLLVITVDALFEIAASLRMLRDLLLINAYTT